MYANTHTHTHTRVYKLNAKSIRIGEIFLERRREKKLYF